MLIYIKNWKIAFWLWTIQTTPDLGWIKTLNTPTTDNVQPDQAIQRVMLWWSSHKKTNNYNSKADNTNKSLCLDSIPLRSYSSSKMKISSAACLLLLLRNAAGSNLRGSRALRELKEQEESVNLFEVSRGITGSNSPGMIQKFY
jgi:hypothetical protein